MTWRDVHAAIVEGTLREPGRSYDDLSTGAVADLLARGLVTEDAPEPASPVLGPARPTAAKRPDTED